MEIRRAYIKSPLGVLCLTESDYGLTGIEFEENWEETTTDFTPFKYIREAKTQLEEYFSGKRREFDIKLDVKATPFQKKVYEELLKIPYGQTLSYGQIANNIGNPKASRAVGMANNRNPISIIIPCHRVIGADGKLVGYGGGLDKKEVLLKLEGWLK